MATRLQCYNSALLLLGERSIASLSENREPRRLLDHVWDVGAIDYCLEQGQWKFATRTVQIDSDPSIDPDFGYQFGFAKPDDFIRTAAVCADGYFNSPVDQYSDEAGYWFADIDPLYVKYVSNDSQFGGDLSLWPQSFVKYFSAYLAGEICEKLTQSATKKAALEKLADDLLKKALSKDAMAGPSVQLPSGSWVRSRRGGGSREGRGNSRSLTG